MESHDGDLERAKINKMSYERMKYEGPGQSKQVEGGQGGTLPHWMKIKNRRGLGVEFCAGIWAPFLKQRV